MAIGLKGVVIAVIGLAACTLAVLPTLDQTQAPKQDAPPASASSDKPLPPPSSPPAPAPAPVERIAPSGLRVVTVDFGGKPFDLEVAANHPEVQKGLSERADIPELTGMLFVYPYRDTLDFWMRNCLVDIDIAFIDDSGVVTAIYTMAHEPLQGATETAPAYEARLKRFSSIKPVRFAIETRAGTNDKLGIKVGTKLPIDARAIAQLSRW